MTHDFLIVGGGIGGTVLAHLLARQGRDVLVIERNLGPPPLVRPELLWPTTVALLRTILSPEAQARVFLPLRAVIVGPDVSHPVFAITAEILEQAGIRPMATDPNLTREELLKPSGFALRRGVEVKSVLKEGGRIVGVRAHELATGQEEDLLAATTIGDDGVHSRVREACGIALDTQLFPIDLLCFGTDWPSVLPEATGRLWPNPDWAESGILGLGILPMPGNKGAAIAPVRPWIFDGPGNIDRARQAWDRFRGSDPARAAVIGTHAFPQGLFRVRRPWGHSPRYGAPGALLLGDAAHPVSPAGGQGANMSVADASALADIIGQDPDRSRWLAEYERRRRPANERSMLFTRRASQVLSGPSGLLAVVIPALVRWLNHHPERIAEVLQFAAGAFQEDPARGQHSERVG